MSTASDRRPATRAEERANALLTAALLVGIVITGNVFARRSLVLRRDFSEDQIYALSPASRAILGRLEDRLQVKAYFTGEILSGEVALAKARIEGLLTECQALAGGLLTVDTVDPNLSSDVLIEARNYGIEGRPVMSFQGTNRVEQDVFLGLALRYRGREAVVSFVEPWSFESAFVSRVHDLLSDRRAVIGWFDGGAALSPAEAPEEGEAPADPAWLGTFGHAQGILARRFEVRRIVDLELGVPVEEDVDVLFVVRPVELHARAAFELDQYVQRGGRLVVLADQVAMSSRTWSGEVRATGLEEMLDLYGAPVDPRHVWDDPWKWPLRVPRVARGQDGEQVTKSYPMPYPLLLRVPAEGFESSVPATSGLQAALFPWAQPIPPVPRPDGVERVDLIRSSPDAYRVDLSSRVVVDPDQIRGQTEVLYASGKGRQYAIAAALSGRFPSPFQAGAPRPLDRFAGEEAGADAPATTDEPVLSRAADGQVVVFGDCDWIRDNGPLFAFFARENEILLSNLADWLTQSDELVALRSRQPRVRGLRDFYQELKVELGVRDEQGQVETGGEAELVMRRDREARSRARSERWKRMLLPVLVTLALVLGFGAFWNFRERRRAGT